MDSGNDITVHLPAELFEALSVVLRTGLEEANIDELVREELKAWWQAESEFMRDDMGRD